jgi:hypothetical protein
MKVRQTHPFRSQAAGICRQHRIDSFSRKLARVAYRTLAQASGAKVTHIELVDFGSVAPLRKRAVRVMVNNDV